MAGILFTSRVGSGQIDAGVPLLMEAVAAVFVGYSILGVGKPNTFRLHTVLNNVEVPMFHFHLIVIHKIL
jgi:ribose/xylose/arabinose/galactoside ABC-type transport system permease subunit